MPRPVEVSTRNCAKSSELSATLANVGTATSSGGRPLFEDFSLRIAAGERVGLIGESGSGKSNLFALLQRFFAVQSGRISIDGQDIAEVTQDSLRAAIAVVPQDLSLLHRSVMENIRCGNPNVTDHPVRAAARAAQCDFIEDLPAGFATIVGTRGLKLSGGQRQRIAIARAFLKEAPILLLDEATSALDSASESAIREALEELMRRRTVIAIAHRLTTLQSVDRIVELKNGRIVRNGASSRLRAAKSAGSRQASRERPRQPLAASRTRTRSHKPKSTRDSRTFARAGRTHREMDPSTTQP